MLVDQSNGVTTMPAVSAGPGGLLEMYRVMALSRVLDERVWQLNRQGKVAIVASAQGHEAAQVAAVRASDPALDHYLTGYRELTTALALGITPEEILLGFLAKEGEPMSSARQFPLHGAYPGPDMVSLSNVIAAQLPQAVGFALADRMRGINAVTIAYFGDGAASAGDTHEAMNFASIHQLPVIFFCENNGYAISVSTEYQMAVEHVADRAAGYGFPGVTVDGANAIAVFEAMSAAIGLARSGGGPSLVEAMVERLLPHTTDDDHTRYRSTEEIAALKERDPLLTTEAQLRRLGLLDDSLRDEILADAGRQVDEANEAADAAAFPDPRDHDIHSNLYELNYGD